MEKLKNKRRVNVGIIDDNVICRSLLSATLSMYEDIDFHILFELESLTSLPLLADAYYHPDIVICDIEMPEINGIEGIHLIKRRFSQTKVLMCSGVMDTEAAIESICRGAQGCIQKVFNREEFFNAIYHVLKGSVYVSPVFLKDVFEMVKFNKYEFDELTGREQDVVDGILAGMSYKLIAYRMKVSENTVRDHIKRIYKKLNINSKGELHAKVTSRSMSHLYN